MPVARSRGSAVPPHAHAGRAQMQYLAEPRPSGACNLLGVPGLGGGYGDVEADEDDCDVGPGPRPKCSPLPRRRSSESDEDFEHDLAPFRTRRVSFADAQGLSLVRVKQFAQWDIPNLPGYESLEAKGKAAEEHYLTTLSSLSLSPEELLTRVHEQRLELETIELLPGSTVLRGLIRVLNVSFDKKVYVRVSLDAWASHFDLLAQHVPGSSDGATDGFSFKLTLVPQSGEQRTRVDFCLRYETPVGTFWANNGDMNYVVFCDRKVKEVKEKTQKENVEKKSCLKAVSHHFPAVETWSSLENQSDVSGNEEVAGILAKQIRESGTLEEDHHKLQVENSRNCSRRNQRRAARLARVKDYFCERGGDASTEGGKAATPETSQIAERRTPRSNGPETQSHPVEYSKSGGSEVIPVATSSKLSPGVQHETLPVQCAALEMTSEKSKTMDTSVCAAPPRTAEQVAAAMSHYLSNSKVQPVSPPRQHLHKSVSSAEDTRQRRMESNRGSVNDESTGTTNTESKLDSNVGLLEPIKGFDGHANSFTFETVVAPLYQQVVGRAESESQTTADHGNPVKERLNKRDSWSIGTIQNYSHPKISETCSSAKDTSKSHSEIPRETQKSSQQCTYTSKEPAPVSEEAWGFPKPQEMLNTDPWRGHVPRGSSHLRGKAREDTLTHDVRHNNPVQSQTTVETARTQPPEDVSSHMETLDAALLHTETNTGHVHTPFSQAHVPQLASTNISAGLIGRECIDESKEKEEVHTTTRASTKTGTNSEWDEPAVVAMSEKEGLGQVKDVGARWEDIDTEKTAEENNWEKMVEEEEVDADVLNEEQGGAETEDKEEAEEVGKEVGKPTEELVEEQCLENREMELEGMEEEEGLMEERTVEEIVVGEEGEVEDGDIIGMKEEEEEGDIIGMKEEEEEEEEGDIIGMKEEEEKEGDIIGIKKEEEEEEGDIIGMKEEGEENEEGDIVEEEDPGEEEVERKEQMETEEIEPKEDTVGVEEEEEGSTVHRVEEELEVEEVGETEVVGEKEESVDIENSEDKTEDSEQRLDAITDDTEENGRGDDDTTNDRRGVADQDDAEGESCILTDDPDRELTGEDSASMESLSDDEVELYMHCLRAVQKRDLDLATTRDRSKDLGFTVARRPSIVRGRQLRMPSICESVDEDAGAQDNGADAETPGSRPAATVAAGRDTGNVAWWRETFSCSNISKALLFTVLLVVFFVAAHHYDFLACFALYLFSVFWLWWQGGRKPVKSSNR